MTHSETQSRRPSVLTLRFTVNVWRQTEDFWAATCDAADLDERHPLMGHLFQTVVAHFKSIAEGNGVLVEVDFAGAPKEAETPEEQ